jgi:hypothetical protein
VEEMDVGMVRRRRTPEARRSNGAVGRHARGGEKMDGGTGTREGEEEDKDARGGGFFFSKRRQTFFCKMVAKSEFCLLGRVIFWNTGCLAKENETCLL